MPTFLIMRLTIFTAAMLFALSGCKEQETEQVYPNRIGTTWEYSVYDSLAGQRDTITVVVVDNIAPSTTIWSVDYPDHREERYSITKGDTLEVFEKVGTQFGYLEARYVFPFYEGAQWNVPPCGEPLSVTDRGPITTYAGSFATAYKLVIDQSCNNDHFRKTEWVVPGVGVVRRQLSYSGTNELWNLISFSD